VTTERDNRFSYLAEILITLAGSPIPSQQFQALADYAEFVLPHDYLGLALITPDGKGYLVHSLTGLVAGAIAPRLFALDEGIVGHVLAQNRVFVTADLTAADVPQTADFEGVCVRFDLRAALVIPIRQGTKAIGALLFLAKSPTIYDEEDVEISTRLAAGLSASLETARMYQVLADERTTLAAVLGSTQDAVLVVNESGTVLLANPAVQPMLGLDAAAIIGQLLEKVVGNGAVLQLFTELPETVPEIALPDGRTAEASLVPVRSEYGEAIGWAAVFHDVTLFKELEQMKNDFVNIVSHDMKNPLSIINMSIDLMGVFGDLNGQQQELQDRIRNTTAYMDELVSDLLDLGKIEAGIDQQLESLDLVALVRSVVDDLKANAIDKQQQVKLDVPPQATLVGDPGQLRQVLLNLVGNAIKYTPEGGEIAISVQIETNKVEVQVKDTGFGIPQADLPFIFDKFYRVGNEQTKDIKGTGLGLAISRSIVEAHGGRISVSSVPDKGSTFTFFLPQ
jgi:PAS domain S-box-containing protein